MTDGATPTVPLPGGLLTDRQREILGERLAADHDLTAEQGRLVALLAELFDVVKSRDAWLEQVNGLRESTIVELQGTTPRLTLERIATAVGVHKQTLSRIKGNGAGGGATKRKPTTARPVTIHIDPPADPGLMVARAAADGFEAGRASRR